MKKSLLTTSLLIMFAAINAQPVYKIYAGQGYTANMYVLDPVTMDTLKFISGAGGYRMTHCPLNNKIYSTGGDANIYVVDAIADSLIAIINPSDGSNNSNELEPIVLSPDQTKLYVADESSGSLFVLNTANDSIINAVTFGNADEMENMVISPDGLTLYVVDNSNVLKINTSTLTIDSTIAVNGDAHGIEISNNGQTIYSESSLGVYVIDVSTFSVIDTITSAGYFLKLNTSNSRLIGVQESNYADITELSTGVTNTVSWSSGGGRGIISHPDNSAYYIASTGGVYKIDAATLSVVDSSDQISFQSIIIIDAAISGINNSQPDFNLLTVFPNPFQSSVTFQMDISTPDDMNISLFEITGGEVKTINSQNIQQGKKEITVDLSGLSSGIYFCKVVCRDKMQTVKIIKN